MRIGGIASGMDTEQMVNDLMRAERMRMDRFFQQEQTVKWRQEAYNDVNKTMANFILDTRKAFGLNTTSNTGSIQNHSAKSFDWVKQATGTNENIVKSTATANAMSGSHKVEVQQLAEVASVSTVDLKEAAVVDDSGKFIQGGEITVTAKDGSKTIEITTSMTMSDLVREINNATADAGDSEGKSLGLRAAYDSSLGQMMITTRESGEEQTIKVTYDEDGLSSKMFKVKTDDADMPIPGTNPFEDISGTNAKILFNGDKVDKATNNFSIYGINLQLQSVSDIEVTINVDTDVDGIFNQISDFVNSYNELLDTMNGATGEKHYRDFPPLTKEQKEGMTEKDIEAWEEKSKSGLLKNDEVLTRTSQSMRSSLYQDVNSGIDEDGNQIKLSGYSHITQVGITTGNYQSGGS